MNTYYLLGAGIAIFALLVQLAMLGLQFSAYRRHGHKSFLILSISSTLALVYSVLASAPYFTPLDMPKLVLLTVVGALIGAAGALFAIFGTILLFKSYRNLAEAATRSPTSGA